MKLLTTLLATLSVTTLATAAHAQDSQFYGTAGLTTYEFDTYALEGKLGYNYNQYLGAEVQGAFSVSDDSSTVDGIDVDTDIDYNFGIFGVARYPILDNAELFVRGGYHVTGVSIESDGGVVNGVTVPGIDFDDDIDGFAIGGGGQYFWDAKNGIRLEYTYLDGENGVNLDTATVSYVRKF